MKRFTTIWLVFSAAYLVFFVITVSSINDSLPDMVFRSFYTIGAYLILLGMAMPTLLRDAVSGDAPAAPAGKAKDMESSADDKAA